MSKVWFSIGRRRADRDHVWPGSTRPRSSRCASPSRPRPGWPSRARDTASKTEYPHVDAAGRPLSPAYKITTTDKQGRFVIEKRIFTDPDRNSLFVRVTVKALKGPVTPTLVLEPHMANTGGGDTGAASAAALTASEGKGVPQPEGDKALRQGLGERAEGRRRPGGLKATTRSANGTIVLTGQLPTVAKEATFDFALGFGPDAKAADATAAATLKTGYTEVPGPLQRRGARVWGWEDYLGLADRAAAVFGRRRRTVASWFRRRP
ncbi:hypothetical protein ACRAWD_10165 [Caulobacter segnis]